MEQILQVKNIEKRYPGVVALSDVSIAFGSGEVHAIIGENGAGKSTLIKIISGAVLPDSGEIIIDGKVYPAMTPSQAIEEGVSVIYQEFNLVDSLSAAENIFLGKRGKGLVDFSVINKKAAEIFQQFGVNIPPTRTVSQLTPAHMQIVEIAKAIHRQSKLIIMDEPTAPLTTSEAEKLFAGIRGLKEQGITIVYISHRLDEIFEIADRVTVLRDGSYVDTRVVAETDRRQLIEMMVGRELKNMYPSGSSVPSSVLLEVKNMCGNGLKDVSFTVRRGEILGFGGLVGAGRTELMRMIYGADPKESGTIMYNGREVIIDSPAKALEIGIGLIPEDRKRHGFIAEQSVAWNSTISNIKKLSRGGVVDDRKEKQQALDLCNQLKIKTPNLQQKVKNLSGGNQQKVVLAKVLAAETDLLIFDEPTRGIDVGARQEIYRLMKNLAREGKAVIMVSSDMEELLGMSDRIVVLSEGRISGELTGNEFSQERVLELASPTSKEQRNK